MPMMIIVCTVLLLQIISTPTHGAPALETSQELIYAVPRTTSLRSNTAPVAMRSHSQRFRNGGDHDDGNEGWSTTMDQTDRNLVAEFPTRAPHFNFWYRSFPPDESPTRAPSTSLTLESAEEEEEAIMVNVPTGSPLDERMPTRAPANALLFLQSAEEPLLPTRAPQFDIEEEPTRAPLWEGLSLRSGEETTIPTVNPPTSAPTPMISGFTDRPTDVAAKTPCYVCGSMNQEITKPGEIVTTDTTLFGSCSDVASRGTNGGFDDCDEVQALVAQVCGCDTAIASSSPPPNTSSPSEAAVPDEESREVDDNSIVAGAPSSSSLGQGSVVSAAYLSALLLGIVLI